MKVGIVLSGGGARGIMHIGVLKALEEFDVKISCCAGTSAGSIVGSLFSYGYTADQMMDIILRTRFLKTLRPAWTMTGLLTLEGLREVLVRLMPENRFEALKIPMTIAATDLRRGKTEYFSKGELIPAVLSSCCVPAVFNPVSFNGSVYVDGGIMDNLPAIAIRDQCDFLIGSHCNFIGNDVDAKNFRTVIERSLLMAISSNTVISKNLCNALIEPPGVGGISGFEVARAKELFEIGYNYTRNNFTASDFNFQSA